MEESLLLRDLLAKLLHLSELIDLDETADLKALRSALAQHMKANGQTRAFIYEEARRQDERFLERMSELCGYPFRAVVTDAKRE